MAPLFRHGKGARVLFNKSDFSGYLNNASVAASCDAAETTTFQKNDKTYIPGLRDVTTTFDGLFSFSTVAATAGSPPGSSEIDVFLPAAIGGSSRALMTIGPEGDSTGRRALMIAGDITGYTIDTPVADVVSLSVDVQGSSGPDFGVWLKGVSQGVVSSSQVGGNVDSGLAAGSTGGATAFMHVIKVRGVATVKVQHSSNNSAWTDLVTFTAASTATVQRSTASGAIKRHLRYTMFTLTGTTKAVTLAVSAARNGKIRN